MASGSVEVKVKMTPTQAGKLLMKKYALEGEVKELKGLVADAVERLCMPIKEIRGDGFSELMGKLRAVNPTEVDNAE